MTPAEARAALVAAIDEHEAAKSGLDAARRRLHAVIRDTAGALPQRDVVRLTGYSRERIRLLTPRPSRSKAS